AGIGVVHARHQVRDFLDVLDALQALQQVHDRADVVFGTDDAEAEQGHHDLSAVGGEGRLGRPRQTPREDAACLPPARTASLARVEALPLRPQSWPLPGVRTGMAILHRSMW